MTLTASEREDSCQLLLSAAGAAGGSWEATEYEACQFPEDKFACRVCLKLFTRNSDVKAHILRVHCGDRRYPCTTCGKR